MYSSGPNAVPPLQLALGKSSVLALVSTTVLSIKALTIAAHGAPLTELWPAGPSQPLAWGIIAWSAAGPGALSAYLHVKGQSMVGPTDAQIVFSTVPLWSALLAAWFLPGEQVGPLSWAGGALMVLAGLIGALGQTKFSGYVREKGKSE